MIALRKAQCIDINPLRVYITNFKITYYAPGTTSVANGGVGRGGYFEVTYDIFSTKDETMTRSVSTVVRLMNPPAVDTAN